MKIQFDFCMVSLKIVNACDKISQRVCVYEKNDDSG